MNIPTLCIDADQQKKLSKYVYLKLMNLGLIMDLLVILLRVSSSRLSLSGHFVNSWVRTPLCFPRTPSFYRIMQFIKFALLGLQSSSTLDSKFLEKKCALESTQHNFGI